MRTRRTDWGLGIALAAAWVFLVQSLAGSFAAETGRILLDAFGNPLCISSTGHDASPDGGHHDKMPGGCVLGCAIACASVATPPDEASLAIHLPAGSGVRNHLSPRILASGDAHDPGSPRAPPALA